MTAVLGDKAVTVPRLAVTTTTAEKGSVKEAIAVCSLMPVIDEKAAGAPGASVDLALVSTHSSSPDTRQIADPFDTDVEAMIPHASAGSAGSVPEAGLCTRSSTAGRLNRPECQMWPGQEHWRKKAKAAKVDRSRCGCMARMSKRNRLLVQLLIGLLIVGIGVAVGFGISKPLGAGVWKPEHQS